MPTGYTSDIAKGITFQQFAMNCARAFGACITMRDDPSDAEIPEEFEASDYHAKELATAQAELARVSALTMQEADLCAASAYSEETAYHDARIKEARDLHAKYVAMLTEVQQWQPPTPDHVEMKKFMEDQILDSIKHDCDVSYYEERVPVRLSAEEWLAKRVASLTWDIEYARKHHAEEIERTNNRTAWIKALRASLSEMAAA